MLELRPTCENCKRLLPASSTEAMICSYECTYCKDCVDSVLTNVCPNCGGGFCPRPIRPSSNLKNNNYLGNDPSSNKVVFNPVDVEQHKDFSRKIRKIQPEKR